jgi:hypothetical protein
MLIRHRNLGINKYLSISLFTIQWNSELKVHNYNFIHSCTQLKTHHTNDI